MQEQNKTEQQLMSDFIAATTALTEHIKKYESSRDCVLAHIRQPLDNLLEAQ